MNTKAIIEKQKELIEYLFVYIESGGGEPNDVYPNFRTSHFETMLITSELAALNEEKSCDHRSWTRRLNFKECIDCGFTWNDDDES